MVFILFAMDRFVLTDAQWARAGVFHRLFEVCSDEPDLEYAMIDATIFKVHRHGQGAKGGLKIRPSAVPEGA